jgi:hypothetical protein
MALGAQLALGQLGRDRLGNVHQVGAWGTYRLALVNFHCITPMLQTCGQLN